MVKCAECKQEVFFADKPPGREDGSLTRPGQVYSNAGAHEMLITGLCEHCFDTLIPEEDE